MAISMKAEQVKYLVAQILQQSMTSITRLELIEASGWKLTIGLFTIILSKGDACYEAKSPSAIASYPTLSPAKQSLISDSLVKVIDTVWKVADLVPMPMSVTNPCAEIPLPTVEPVIEEPVTVGVDKGAGDSTAAFLYSTPLPQKKAVEPEGPVADIIPLYKAKAVRQKVKGTSDGSTYTTVAVGELNVAVRITAGKVSVRAEFAGGGKASDTVSNLVGLGFTDNGKYLSMHIVLEGVPAERIVGSLLYSMGVKFSSIATSTGDFK